MSTWYSVAFAKYCVYLLEIQVSLTFQDKDESKYIFGVFSFSHFHFVEKFLKIINVFTVIFL